MSDAVILEVDGAIARVTLNRPDAFNAMNRELRDSLKSAIGDIHRNEAIRVVILGGAGRGFCAGTDLAEELQTPVYLLLEQEYRPILNAIGASDKIWISRVQGSAAGIGAALAMQCDLMTIGEESTIYMAFAAIGLVPDGGNTWLLHRALGYKRALQAILEGRKISAAEAVQFGLANTACSEAALHDETDALARRIVTCAPLASRAAKRLLRAMDGLSYDSAFSAEATEQTTLLDSDDFREGVSAFFDKRQPHFKGA